VVSRPEPSIGRSFLVGLGLIVGVALLALVLSEWIPAAGYWAGLLYLLPIYWAADRHRLGGALASAAGVGLAIMTAQAIARGGDAPAMTLAEEIQIYAYLLGFYLIAILLGVARERESDLLERLADSNRRLRGDLQRVVRALTGAVEAKDSYTEGHLQRVSAYALEVGRRLGLDAADLEMLQIASALHDIGKIGIPEHILNKPGRLDPAERVIIERHPEIGARILESVDGLEAAAPLVRYHQERWDGGRDGDFPGYPDGLEREAIPLGARIIAVVDAFDAMTTDRAYRAARPTERAVAVLQDERGRQFDPRVVDVFLELLAERPWA
jgi:HD-GYP domain-containing protein (c-di-GMP phosphodiesterase class II)